MKYLTAILFIMVLPYSGFSQQTINGSITHNSIQRDYIIYVPGNYTGDRPVPLVFNFHGYGGNSSGQMWYGNFQPIADTAGFIIVHPQGTLFNETTHWNVGGWTLGSTTDDVDFIEVLIESLSSEYNIDPKRVYSTGFSNGGFFSFLLACQLGDKIAAIASVAGSMTPETSSECNPQHPTPILQIHGTSDGTVLYDGAGWTPIEDVIRYWVNYNNCNQTASTTSLPDINTADGNTVEHIVYDECDNNVNTEHLKVIGGHHTWPGTSYGDWANQDIDASLEIWKFFSRYDIDGFVEITGGEIIPVDTGGEIIPVDTGGEIIPVDTGGEITPVDTGVEITPIDTVGVVNLSDSFELTSNQITITRDGVLSIKGGLASQQIFFTLLNIKGNVVQSQQGYLNEGKWRAQIKNHQSLSGLFIIKIRIDNKTLLSKIIW